MAKSNIQFLFAHVDCRGRYESCVMKFLLIDDVFFVGWPESETSNVININLES